MDLELGFDYKEAIERQNIKESDIELLKEKVKAEENVPETLTNKQVSNSIFKIYSLWNAC